MNRTDRIVDNALAARDMVPANPVCPCCGETDRDAFSPYGNLSGGLELTVFYGSTPCDECADEHMICVRCSRPFLFGDEWGEGYCSQSCCNSDASDAANERELHNTRCR